MALIPKIEMVRPLGNTRLLIRFMNGEQKIYDCSRLLSHPRFQILSAPAFFNAVKVDAGGYGISWNDDIDLSEYELWTNGFPVDNNEV